MARQYSGQKQGHHIIRSCFGGIDNKFIVSGSEGENKALFFQPVMCRFSNDHYFW